MDHWSRWNNESSNLQLVLYFRSLRVHAPLHFSNDRTPALSLESSYKENVRYSGIGCFVPDPLRTFISSSLNYEYTGVFWCIDKGWHNKSDQLGACICNKLGCWEKAQFHVIITNRKRSLMYGFVLYKNRGSLRIGSCMLHKWRLSGSWSHKELPHFKLNSPLSQGNFKMLKSWKCVERDSS